MLNEKTRAEHLITSGEPSSDVKSAMSLLTRYYAQVRGLGIYEICEETRRYLVRAWPSISLQYVDSHLRRYAERATDRPLVMLDHVEITGRELECISKLKGIRVQCLAFAALAISKYDCLRCQRSCCWIQEHQFGEIIRRANITVSENDAALLLHQMFEAGMIEMSHSMSRGSFRILFAETDGAGIPLIKLEDSDFLDLGYAYRANKGDPFVRCEECRRWVKKSRNGRTRFCKNCAANNHKKHALAYANRKKSTQTEI